MSNLPKWKLGITKPGYMKLLGCYFKTTFLCLYYLLGCITFQMWYIIPSATNLCCQKDDQIRQGVWARWLPHRLWFLLVRQGPGNCTVGPSFAPRVTIRGGKALLGLTRSICHELAFLCVCGLGKPQEVQLPPSNFGNKHCKGNESNSNHKGNNCSEIGSVSYCIMDSSYGDHVKI